MNDRKITIGIVCVALLIAFTACTSVPDGQGETLNSLTLIDPYPVWTMKYIADYGLDRILATGARTEAELAERLSLLLRLAALPKEKLVPVGMGCTGFSALSTEGEALFGHNEDWEKGSYLILFTRPSNGYAAATVVDTGWLSILKAEDRAFLATPYLPLAGMNSEGLAVSGYSVPLCSPPFENEKVSLLWPVVIRLLLDRAKTVDEAITLLRQYNVSFADGNLLQFHLADAEGHSVIVEWLDGKIVVIPKKDVWQAVTNFIQWGAQPDAFENCWRYALAKKLLDSQGGIIDMKFGMDILSRTSQVGWTQFSVLFNLSARTMQIVFGRNYGKVYDFALE